jgi:hypothetical protein
LAFTLPYKSSSLLDASHSTGKGIYRGKGIKLHLHSAISTGKGKTTAALIAKHESDAAYQIAQVYAYRGQFDKSFEWLERAYEQRDPGLPEIKSNPLVKNLRRDQKYTALLKKLRLSATE